MSLLSKNKSIFLASALIISLAVNSPLCISTASADSSISATNVETTTQPSTSNQNNSMESITTNKVADNTTTPPAADPQTKKSNHTVAKVSAIVIGSVVIGAVGGIALLVYSLRTFHGS